ncbi:MAG: YciI-like protein [Parvularculaceae bacterium]|nr:YciI-like protein [Parvularculaceae bacterium]
MKHFLLIYEADGDYAARRTPYRAAHLAHARAAKDRGEIVLAGGLADPVDGSVLLFQGDTDEAARRFAQTDPYVTNNVVQRWRVREWTTVIGDLALTEVKL